MTPMLSRTSIIREVFRRRMERRQNNFEEEDSIIIKNEECEEKEQFDGNYLKHINDFDEDMCINDPENFNKMLQYFWNGVGDYIFDLDIILDTLCKAFPKYIKEIYESCYNTFINSFGISSDFVFLLDCMADWDEVNDSTFFSKLVQKSYEQLIDSLDAGSPYADIIWILENRFNVDSAKVEDSMCKLFHEIYKNYSLSELIYEYALNELFKVPAGYAMFFDYIVDVMQRSDYRVFQKLQEDYGIMINIECKVNID